MFDKPLFRENIINNIRHFFTTYFTSTHWWIWIAIVFLVMALFLFLLRKQLRNNQSYATAYDKDVFYFCHKKTADIFSLLFLITAFVITAVYMFSLENTLFENYDLMSFNTTRLLKGGGGGPFSSTRIIPLSFWYMNILYAVTENIFMIKSFVLLHLALAVYVLYKVFEFIPASKRLMVLAVFVLTPTMFQTSSIIYCESSQLIWIGLSLIAARNYCKTGKVFWVAWFLFFMNFAIYIKETAILFYFGLVVSSVAYSIWNEKFTLSSFIHPIKTIKNMPLEFLMGVSLFLYAVIYFILISTRTNYATYNKYPLIYTLDYYKAEVVLMLITLGIFILQTIKKKNFDQNLLFKEGSWLLGSLSVMLCLLFYFNLAPMSLHLNGKTHYMVIPVLFCLVYLFSNLKNKYVLGSWVFIILTYSFVQNYKLYQKEPGHYYREAAEFFTKNLSKNEPNSIYLVEQTIDDNVFWRNTWMAEVWSSSYHYYFEKYNISFKYLNKEMYKKPFLLIDSRHDRYFFRMYPWGMPDSGDWLVLHKQASSEDLEKFRAFIKNSPVFENKIFEIYKIQ